MIDSLSQNILKKATWS